MGFYFIFKNTLVGGTTFNRGDIEDGLPKLSNKQEIDG